jgi:alpha-glucuronidase
MACRTRRALLTASVFILFCPFIVRAETGEAAWLRYAPLNETNRGKYDFLPADVVKLGESAVLQSSQNEIIRGIKGMLGRTLRADTSLPHENAIILGTIASIQAAAPEWRARNTLRAGGFLLTTARIRGFDCVIVAGGDENGVLYGSFALLRKIALGDDLKALNDREEPSAPLRWINQWDNINGTIERGYGGPSIFFDRGKVRDDLSRVSEYGRLLASLGINGCSVNNVNADTRCWTKAFFRSSRASPQRFGPGACASSCPLM